jgi:hypothetical protein
MISTPPIKIMKRGIIMGRQDVFNCAKSAISFYNAYLKTVCEEIGIARALSLHMKINKTMGIMQGKMIKKQSGTEEIDANAALSLAKSVPESFGISMEIVEENPKSVVFKVIRCPIYEAAQMVGMDEETIETLCLSGLVIFMDALIRQLNHNFSYRLQRFRSGPNDFCEEVIIKDQSFLLSENLINENRDTRCIHTTSRSLRSFPYLKHWTVESLSMRSLP